MQSTKQHKHHKQAFTLIELLVVIAIIALLAAILFPVFAQAREKVRQTSCLSNMRQIGLSLRMYIQDYDETFPIFYAYHTQPPADEIGHQGVEVLLLPYTKNKEIFRCPNDSGGPVPQNTPSNIEYGGCSDKGDKARSYRACYGTSYRFARGGFSIIDGVSHQNNILCTPTNDYCLPSGPISDAAFAQPSDTYVMREEMLPWFGGDKDPSGTKYGYYPDYYKQWHPGGGSFVFADGHAKFMVSGGQFDKLFCSPDATKNFSNFGWGCD
jgi:prepilin-type N-terminal cleavage/methylation domain-containing protein/prepilin-type processing-associated H-X9-DG protein